MLIFLFFNGPRYVTLRVTCGLWFVLLMCAGNNLFIAGLRLVWTCSIKRGKVSCRQVSVQIMKHWAQIMTERLGARHPEEPGEDLDLFTGAVVKVPTLPPSMINPQLNSHNERPSAPMWPHESHWDLRSLSAMNMLLCDCAWMINGRRDSLLRLAYHRLALTREPGESRRGSWVSKCDSHSLGDARPPWQPGCSGDNRGWGALRAVEEVIREGNAVANECWGAQRVTAGSPVWLNGNGAGLFRPVLRDFPPFFFSKEEKVLAWLCCYSRLGDPPFVGIHWTHTGVVKFNALVASEGSSPNTSFTIKTPPPTFRSSKHRC